MSILARGKFGACMDSSDAELEFEFDHLLLALGSETNFFDNAGIRDWAVTMKNLSDAALLRNRMVAFLEEATLEKDAAARRQWLTFVIAGGGFAGAETAGAVNDFVRETAKFYPRLGDEEIRVVVIHPGDYLLPELGEELGRYAERKLRERKVEVIKGARVASYDGWVVTLNNGISIPAATLIWTAGVKPSPVVAALPCPKEKGRICANEYLQVPGFTGLWAAGDCAAVPDPERSRKLFIRPLRSTECARRSSRRRTSSAQFSGNRCSRFDIERWACSRASAITPAWRVCSDSSSPVSSPGGCGARFILMKLPRMVKKLRVMMAWTLDLLFGRDIEQMITLRDVEELSERWARIRAERKPVTPLGSQEIKTSIVVSQDKGVAMDTTIVSALAGIVGSLCGGSASVATAWVTQKTRNKRERMRAEVRKTRSALRRIHQRMLASV